MPQRAKTILVQAGSFLLGGGLLYLALRNVDFAALGEALASANYWYLVPLVALTLGSHVFRAWRWQMLLETLPATDDAQRPVGFKVAFFSLMIGYMVNYAAPRLGEVARTANVATRSRLPFSGVFGTVIVERIVDVLTLAVGILAAVLLMTEEMATLAPLFEPAAALLREPPVAWSIIITSGLFVTLGLAALLLAVLRRSARSEGLAARVSATLHSFTSGLASIFRAPRRVGIVLTTVAIWVCYLFMAYLPLPMLGITSIDLSGAWVLLIVGAVGMSVPSPGGIGSYHYVTIRTLEGLFAVATPLATAYAVLSHAAQLVLYAVAGFVCLVLQGSGFSDLRAEIRQRDEAYP
ncbi:MAG: lysylphosphatidylglycerol synthase transmembrane domain-containing protein [Bacteroidota bacterium]